jgi:hypothetical protein
VDLPAPGQESKGELLRPFLLFILTLMLEYFKFEKSKAVDNYLLTGELNTAVCCIDQAMSEAIGLDDNAFEALYRQLTESQLIIKSVIPRKCFHFPTLF